MTTATHHPRIEDVIQETLQVLNDEVMAGRINSDLAIDKVQHLINTVRKYAAAVPERGRRSDREAAPSSAYVDVVNVVNVPTMDRPEVMTVETTQQIGFIALSFGLVNLHQVALLDVDAKQLYLVGGIMRSLNEMDMNKLRHWSQLYQLR